MAKIASKSRPQQSSATTNGTIQAVDLPVGVVARATESVRPLAGLPNRLQAISREASEARIQRIREQIATELKQSEKRGAELRRQAVQRVQPLRSRLGEQVGRVRERIATLR